MVQWREEGDFLGETDRILLSSPYLSLENEIPNLLEWNEVSNLLETCVSNFNVYTLGDLHF